MSPVHSGVLAFALSMTESCDRLTEGNEDQVGRPRNAASTG